MGFVGLGWTSIQASGQFPPNPHACSDSDLSASTHVHPKTQLLTIDNINILHCFILFHIFEQELEFIYLYGNI